MTTWHIPARINWAWQPIHEPLLVAQITDALFASHIYWNAVTMRYSSIAIIDVAIQLSVAVFWIEVKCVL